MIWLCPSKINIEKHVLWNTLNTDYQSPKNLFVHVWGRSWSRPQSLWSLCHFIERANTISRFRSQFYSMAEVDFYQTHKQAGNDITFNVTFYKSNPHYKSVYSFYNISFSNYFIVDDVEFARHVIQLSSSGVVVKLLACRARSTIPGLSATISEISYVLLPRRSMAEISLQRQKSKYNQKTLSSMHKIVVCDIFTWRETRR